VSALEAAGAAQTCGRCQTPARPGETRRSACQSWLRGNDGAVTHGGRRRRAPTDQPARNSELDRQWAQDLGGEDALSTAQREVLAGLVASIFVRYGAERYLSQARLSMTSERIKRALEVFFKSNDAALKGALALGLAKRAKDVPDLASDLAQHDGETGPG
jgi:hypothetical protein